MSAEPVSSNPFRRKGPSISTSSFPGPGPVSTSIPTSTIFTSTSTSTSTSDSAHAAYQHLQTDPSLGTPNSIPEVIGPPKKATKKVRVQSPPPSSPSLRDSASTIGEDTFPIAHRPPISIPGDEADPFDTISPDVSDDEAITWPTKAPPNPFQKTLESMERPEREGSAVPVPSVASPGRASLDVEAFKRLLMTGNAGLGTSAPSPPALAPAAHHSLGDGYSSTDTSSISRQSIFEAIQEPQPESPRTSHEISEPDDYRRGLVSDSQSVTSGRKKPHPPSSRHGKLITVELRDDAPANTLNSPLPPTSTTRKDTNNSSLHSNPSQSDLNKPLPLAPNRASHESDRESIFDREAAGKIPESTSPFPPIKRKIPPAPPISRRHSHRIPDSNLARSNSVRLSPKVEERDNEIDAVSETGRPRSNSAKAPPPPPSRRPAVTQNSSHHSPLSSPSTVSLPAPPPARGTSRQSSSGRPVSVLSLDMTTNNKRASVAPPPPPRSRHGRSSLDAPSPGESRRLSGEQSRQSIDSNQHDPEVSSPPQAKGVEGLPGGHDILADLSALQREIDALRSQSEKERVT
ncbi:uncharacterized protein BP5553_08255 [Venustampulla echinocandica]|uniref:Uncharacterized protein n=1 Tax=Venustampulla echinocandica TaxID=2656787 RepID=A0A370TG58_9HELO|nr:uncharacterized protein BP5553_08255 [Venustampulla echinocandica]RDL33887.1 hypothetical protein BP5553_08255 [Venustampulla echinocandica]